MCLGDPRRHHPGHLRLSEPWPGARPHRLATRPGVAGHAARVRIARPVRAAAVAWKKWKARRRRGVAVFDEACRSSFPFLDEASASARPRAAAAVPPAGHELLVVDGAAATVRSDAAQAACRSRAAVGRVAGGADERRRLPSQRATCCCSCTPTAGCRQARTLPSQVRSRAPCVGPLRRDIGRRLARIAARGLVHERPFRRDRHLYRDQALFVERRCSTPWADSALPLMEDIATRAR